MNRTGRNASRYLACTLAACVCLFLGCEDDDDSSSSLDNTLSTPDREGTAENVTLIVDESNNGNTTTIQVGDTLQIELAGNPSTSFTWDVASYSTSVLNQLGDGKYNEVPADPENPMLGQGGTYTFMFEAIAAGQTLVTLHYDSPYDDAGPVDTFQITSTTQ